MNQNPGNMEHDYFDKKMQEILSQSPDAEPSARELETMRQRLAMLPPVDHTKPSSIANAWKKWWPLLLLLITCSIGYWSFLQNRRITQLEQLLTQYTRSKTDTLFIERTTHQVDTIYHFTVQKSSIEPSSSSPNYWLRGLQGGQEPFFYYRDRGLTLEESPSLFGRYTSPFARMGTYSLSNYARPLVTDTSTTHFSGKATSTDTPSKDLLSPDPTPNLPSSPMPILPSIPAAFHATPLSFPSFKKKQPLLSSFRPEGLSMHVHLQPLTWFTQDNRGYAGGAGSLLQVHLPGERRLGIGAEYLFHNFEAKNNLSQFPSDDRDDPSDVLREVYGRLQFVQIPILLEQRFRTQGRWVPSLQLGWVAYRPIRQAFRYEYFSATIGDYNQSLQLDDASWLSNNWRLGLSLERKWQQNWSSRIQVQYQHASATEIPLYLRLRYLGLQVSMERRF